MSKTNLTLTQRLIYYVGVGGTAALANLVIVLCLVHFAQYHPLSANIIAFFIAFNISYFGHKYLTFSKLEQKQLRLPHFFLVATTAGIINEALYYLFLRYTHLHYMASLVLVLALVSIYSYILSRFWACR